MAVVFFTLLAIIALLLLVHYLILVRGILNYLKRNFPEVHEDTWESKAFKKSSNPYKFSLRYYRLQYLILLTGRLALDARLQMYVNLYRVFIVGCIIFAVALIFLLDNGII